jgi:CubicO group peptidase (beta-lactamase class C family)
VLVSAAVEAAAGEPFSAFMASQVFAPLAMVDTATDVAHQRCRTGSRRTTATFPAT